MSKYIVNHSGPLRGEVGVSGAKNAVLPLMAAALLSEDKCVIRDVPHLRDVSLMKELLVSLGSEITESGEDVLSIETKDILSTEADFELVNQMRASILVMGPLLARKGRAKVHLPGGCAAPGGGEAGTFCGLPQTERRETAEERGGKWRWKIRKSLCRWKT